MLFRVVSVVLLGVFAAALGFAQDAKVSSTKLMAPIGVALVRASDGDWPRTSAEIDRFEQQWIAVKNQTSKDSQAVNTALTAVRDSLKVNAPDSQKVRAALSVLSGAVNSLSAPQAGSASREDAKPLLAIAEKALGELNSGNAGQAGSTFKAFVDAWPGIENSVRAVDVGAYGDFEIRMSLARAALQSEPPQFDKAIAQVSALRDALNSYVSAKGATATGTRPGSTAQTVASSNVPSAAPHIADLVAMLNQTQELLHAGNAVAALEIIQAFIRTWPAVETEVKAGSADAYGKVENAMTEALAALMSTPADIDNALSLVTIMQGQLEPLSDRASYTAWHAGLTLFREGLEALLVLVALLALLKKTGQGGKQGWVWSGVGSGLALSGLLAFVFVGLISSVSAGSARESLEGYVGLGSVLLMLSVGAWLHGKSNIQSWNSFIKKTINGALQKGSLWGLFFVALLAVLREGAETVIFFLGIAPSIETGQLILGIVVALAVLAGLGFAIIRFSVKLPFHIMFLSASILIYFLAFKILGQSIHALQISGALPIHGAALPSVEFFGMFPTWETTLPQLVIFFMVVTEVTVTETKRRRAKSGEPARPGKKPGSDPNPAPAQNPKTEVKAAT